MGTSRGFVPGFRATSLVERTAQTAVHAALSLGIFAVRLGTRLGTGIVRKLDKVRFHVSKTVRDNVGG